MGMEWRSAKRRDKLSIVRDALISLELAGQPMKPTRLMYALNMSWDPFRELLRALIERQLVEGIRPEGYMESRKSWDRRTKVLLEISLKGKYVLRMLDEFLNYLDDTDEPRINPPAWLMRKAFALRGFDLLPPPKDNPKQLPQIFEELLNLKNTVVDGDAEELTKEPEKVIAIPDPDMVRGSTPKEEVFCPECGTKCKGLGGLRIHVGHKHFEKRKEIMETVKSFEAGRIRKR